VIDLPGFGLSHEPPFAWTINEYELFLEAFITHHQINDVTLLCHSFGGRIGLIYAAKNILKALIITGGAGLKPHRSLTQKLKSTNYQISKKILKIPGFKKYQTAFYRNSGSVDYQNASPLMKQVLVKTVNADLTNTLPAIKCPTLLY